MLGSLGQVRILRFNTQPRGGGCGWMGFSTNSNRQFQHTAARRRLPKQQNKQEDLTNVSTHSRAEAAAAYFLISQFRI